MSAVHLRGRQHVTKSLESLSQLVYYERTNDKGEVVGYFNNEAAIALDIIFNLHKDALENDFTAATDDDDAADALGQGKPRKVAASTPSPNSNAPAYELQWIDADPAEFSKPVRKLLWPLTGGEEQRQSMHQRRQDHFVKTPFGVMVMFVPARVHLLFDCMLVPHCDVFHVQPVALTCSLFLFVLLVSPV